MAHQTQLHPAKQGGRFFVMDNFYTRHLQGRQLDIMSDCECKILGTVRFNNVDGPNRPALKDAIESLRNASPGDWRRVQVYNQGNTAESPLTIAEKCGFVVFKDRSIVAFYKNNLADTPIARVHQPDDAHAVMCVHGLVPLLRWTGSEALNRTKVYAPAVIVAYNLFMNGVDRCDQLRSTTATVQKERRVTMSILTFILDASVINAHALLKAITKSVESIIDITLMKQRIIEQLVRDYADYQQTRVTLPPISRRTHPVCLDTQEATAGGNRHLLFETENRKSVHCFLCSLRSEKGRGGYTFYSCCQCHLGFHVNCFTSFHFKDSFRDARPGAPQ